MTNRDLRYAYKYYNRKFFGGVLPPATVKFRRMPKRHCSLGVTYKEDREININWELRNWMTIAHSTLLHEMVHMFLPARYTHGPIFQRAMLHLATQGAFEKLW